MDISILVGLAHSLPSILKYQRDCPPPTYMRMLPEYSRVGQLQYSVGILLSERQRCDTAFSHTNVYGMTTLILVAHTSTVTPSAVILKLDKNKGEITRKRRKSSRFASDSARDRVFRIRRNATIQPLQDQGAVAAPKAQRLKQVQTLRHLQRGPLQSPFGVRNLQLLLNATIATFCLRALFTTPV